MNPAPSVDIPELRTSSGCTCFKLRSLSRRVTQFYDRALAACGLKVTQFSLLAHALRAQREGSLSVSELARLLASDRTTVTRNLRPLVAAGLIEVGAGGDARSRSVVVTPAGAAAYRAALPIWREAETRMRVLLGGDQIAQLHDLIAAALPRFGGADEASDDA